MIEFTPFPKIARLFRDVVITEKIDGTNASVWITSSNDEPCTEKAFANAIAKVEVDGYSYPMVVRAGSRKRFLNVGKQFDNFQFASWVKAHAEELAVGLGEGVHYGEWWGKGIQRGYGLMGKKFSLLNAGRWFNHDWPEHDDTAPDGMERAPACCGIVPVLGRGLFDSLAIKAVLARLEADGSEAAPGFMDPEGIVIYHTHSGQSFKVTIGDDGHKWEGA